MNSLISDKVCFGSTAQFKITPFYESYYGFKSEYVAQAEAAQDILFYQLNGGYDTLPFTVKNSLIWILNHYEHHQVWQFCLFKVKQPRICYKSTSNLLDVQSLLRNTLHIPGLRVECNATLKQADQTETILPVTWVEKKDGKWVTYLISFNFWRNVQNSEITDCWRKSRN